MADNSYAIEIKYASSAGYYTPAQAKSYYGKYSRDGVTYHWWNSPDKIRGDAAAHDSIVNYLNGRAAAGQAPTANYVLSEYKLTLCVSPDNVAWTSSNGNATTIGVECSPHFTEAWYKKTGWLHDQLEQRYNKTLAIYVHFEWQAGTSCSPIVKQKIRDYANWWKAQRQAPVPKPTPTPPPPTNNTVTLQISDITNKKVKVHRTANLWDLGFTKYADAKAINPKEFPNGFPVGHVIEVSALAEHPLGSKYYLTEYSFSRGVGAGINVKDCQDYVDPVAPPKDTSVVQPPKDAPINEAPVITPIPTPVPIPVPIDDETSNFLKSLVVKLGEIIKSITDFLTKRGQ